jgi:hypothetical protein
MKLAIMQPYFFPYLGYFQLISSVDKFMLYENVPFRCKSWITRNYLKPNNGSDYMLTIPVMKKSSLKPIYELRITDIDSWTRKTMKFFYMGYKKAVHFDETYSMLENIMKHPPETLHEFNCCSIAEVCKNLSINTQLSVSHQHYLEFECELNRMYDLSDDKIHKTVINYLDKKMARINHICKKEGAKTYHNAINGMKLYQKADLEQIGIELYFIQTNPLEYKQFNHCFTPNLSIIDVLMHCGTEITKKFLNAYQLI